MRQNEEIIKSRPASSLISIFILRQRMGVDRRSLQPARELWGSLRVKPSTRSLLDMNLCGWLSHVVTIQNIMFKGRTTTCDIIWRLWSFSASTSECSHAEAVKSELSLESPCASWTLRPTMTSPRRALMGDIIWSWVAASPACDSVTRDRMIRREEFQRDQSRWHTWHHSRGHPTCCCLHWLTF